MDARCSKDRHWFGFGPDQPCQCLKYLRSPDTRPEPIHVAEPINRPQDHAPYTGVLTAQILRACTEPKTSAEIARELDKSAQSIRVMLNNLRLHGRVRIAARVGRVAFYSRVTAEIETGHTVN